MFIAGGPEFSMSRPCGPENTMFRPCGLSAVACAEIFLGRGFLRLFLGRPIWFSQLSLNSKRTIFLKSFLRRRQI